MQLSRYDVPSLFSYIEELLIDLNRCIQFERVNKEGLLTQAIGKDLLAPGDNSSLDLLNNYSFFQRSLLVQLRKKSLEDLKKLEKASKESLEFFEQALSIMATKPK